MRNYAPYAQSIYKCTVYSRCSSKLRYCVILHEGRLQNIVNERFNESVILLSVIKIFTWWLYLRL